MSSSTASRPKVNLRSTAVKRIMQEASELANPEEDDFVAGPLESDIFEWHCTMRGVTGSEYEGGLYHLRIVLPPSYPMSAPDIILLTPSGRFELGKKICIDGLTSFHAGSWQPAWGVRTAITGLRSFWMQTGEALSAIGALDYPKEERRRLAKLSREWKCPNCCVMNRELLPDRTKHIASASASTSESFEASAGPSKEETDITIPVEAQPNEPESPSEPTLPTVQTQISTLPESLTDLHLPSSLPLHDAPATPTPSRPPIRPTLASRSLSWLAPRQIHDPPLWLDICLASLITILIALIYKRMA